MGGLEPMQLMQVRQVIGEQVGQARGVPEMFGQRATNGFPQSMDPMHVPGSSGRPEQRSGIRLGPIKSPP